MKVIKKFVLITIPTLIILFLILEVFSILFFPGKQPIGPCWDNEYSILKFSNIYGESGTWTRGNFSQQRGRWRVNNEGWNSPFDYKKEKESGITRIAVIGDSYVEALQVDVNNSFSFILDSLMGEKTEVYAFGKSGYPLSQYLHVARYVKSKFDPDIYVVNMVTNDFKESLFEFARTDVYNSIKISSDEILEIPPSGKGEIKKGRTYYISKSSFLCFLFFNHNLIEYLNFSKFFNRKEPKEFEMNVDLNDLDGYEEEIEEMTFYVLSKFKEEILESNKKVIFVMDGPRQFIYDNELENSKTIFLNKMVKNIADTLELPLIDLTYPMLEDFKKNNINFESKFDFHWNEYGHQFVAGEIYELIKNDKKSKIDNNF